MQQIQNQRAVFKDWYKTIFPFNRAFSTNTILHLKKGGEVFIRNMFSHEMLWAVGYYLSDEYKLDSIMLPPQATIIDLGANMGFFSIEAHARWPDAHIVAYEPSPKNFAYLVRNAPFAKLVPKAVSGSRGTMRFTEAGSPAAYHLSPTGEMEVEVVTLNDVLEGLNKVALLKIDIEGAEFDMLRNASADTIKKIDRILVETQGDEIIGQKTVHGKTYTIRSSTKTAMEELLKSFGFQVEWIVDYGVAYAEKV